MTFHDPRWWMFSPKATAADLRARAERLRAEQLAQRMQWVRTQSPDALALADRLGQYAERAERAAETAEAEVMAERVYGAQPGRRYSPSRVPLGRLLGWHDKRGTSSPGGYVT